MGFFKTFSFKLTDIILRIYMRQFYQVLKIQRNETFEKYFIVTKDTII